jgi:selenocysteine lyase/cysteine desulfurase
VAEGDEILLLEGQFPSNIHPWGAAVRRGARVRVAPRPLGADPTDAVLAALSPRTRIVSVDWVSFIDGAVCDLGALGSLLRARDIRFVVDGAQGVGALRLDWPAAGIDVLAAPSHKWLLGPVGCGFLAVAPERLDAIQDWNSGWVNLAMAGGFRNLLQGDGAPPPDATRFETGSPAYALLAPWGASLDLLAEIGAEAIEQRVTALAGRTLDGVLALAPAHGGRRGLVLVSPPPGARRSGIVAFRAQGEETIALYRSLTAARITVALREGSIRAAPHLYNTEDEIDALLAACRSFLA